MMHLRQTLRSWLTALSLAAAPALTALPASAETVTVFAAASLKSALDQLAQTLPQEGLSLQISYGGSSALARQIQYGAPADLFISANQAWMDLLESEGLIAPGSRIDLAGNRLAAVAHAGLPAPPASLQAALESRAPDDRIAMALTEAVPAGIYGKQALQALGLWQQAAPHVVQADNVRAALRLTALGEAALGIVYATDLQAAPGVRLIEILPETSHSPIRYPMALTTDHSQAARAAYDQLRSPAAAGILAQHGFAPLAADP
jgi:molybdate transport system substrate-binding protein